MRIMALCAPCHARHAAQSPPPIASFLLAAHLLRMLPRLLPLLILHAHAMIECDMRR